MWNYSQEGKKTTLVAQFSGDHPQQVGRDPVFRRIAQMKLQSHCGVSTALDGGEQGKALDERWPVLVVKKARFLMSGGPFWW